MVGFMREFFKTVFFELRNKIRRRRLRREATLAELEHKVSKGISDQKKKDVQNEIEARQAQATIAKHKIPDNPYDETTE